LITESNSQSVGIVTIGFNRFREINDGMGYAFGDKLLAAFAQRLREEFWSRDTVANFGGDQFSLLLPIKEQAHWNDVVKKVRDILSVPFTIQDINILVDVSMGISLYPDDGKDSLTLIKCAEIAMHNAKKMGLFYECYSIENDPNNIDRLEMISELNDAVKRDEFELYYQPKIDIKEHALIGAEALIRWDNPKRGFVRPDIFIELAEQGRIIKDITNWVIEEALRQCSVWHKNDFMCRISINISACLLIGDDIVLAVDKAIKKHDVDPDYLILEITETAIVMHPKRALETMNKLKSLGVHLSIDDFGTGYTSISLIKNLPVSEIKVDKSFVLNMDTNIEDATLVKLIVDLAHTLKHKVVAEGIENAEVLSMLNEMGCDIAQGFYLGKPMPAKEFDAFTLK
jgi:diguanylate cyclase (GGDEF)-like protein